MSRLQQMLAIIGALPPRPPPSPRSVFRPDLLSRSSKALIVTIAPETIAPELRVPQPQHYLLAWSPEVLAQLLRGVVWHDEVDREHCRTWSAGCRCDLGDES